MDTALFAHLVKCATLMCLSCPGSAGGLSEGSPAAARRPEAPNEAPLARKVTGNTVRPTREDLPSHRRRRLLLPPPLLQLPVFLHSRVPLVRKENFSPASGTGYETLPDSIREVLLPVAPSRDARPANHLQPPAVSVFCRVDKMRVLIIKNRVAYSNTLRYNPPSLAGPIRRAASFTLPTSCHYNRYQYSYKIGYTPKMRKRKVFKSMRNRVKFILTPRNAQWDRLSLSDQFVIGRPMYFQVEAPSMSPDKRLYVQTCNATMTKSHTSLPRFAVIDNFGCMVESKDNRSRFIPYQNNVVRFTVDAFIFRGMMGQQLYMHCVMFEGSSTPTPTAKACNYDTTAGRWQELYGSISACSCCGSTCSSTASAVTKLVSSRPWTIEHKINPPTNLTTTTTTTAAASKMETKMVTPPPEETTAVGDVEEWPLSGVDGDRHDKGFAAVEKEPFIEPRRTFEEFFGMPD